MTPLNDIIRDIGMTKYKHIHDEAQREYDSLPREEKDPRQRESFVYESIQKRYRSHLDSVRTLHEKRSKR